MMQFQDPRKHPWGRVVPFSAQSALEEMLQTLLCPCSHVDSENYKMAISSPVLTSKERREIEERLKEHSNKVQTTYSSQTAYSKPPPHLSSLSVVLFLLLSETQSPSPFIWSKSPEAPTDDAGTLRRSPLLLMLMLGKEQGRDSDLESFRSSLFLLSHALQSLHLWRDSGSSLQLCNPSASPPWLCLLVPERP